MNSGPTFTKSFSISIGKPRNRNIRSEILFLSGLLRQNSKHAERLLRPHVYLAVRDGRRGELICDREPIAGSVLSAVEEFGRYIGGVVGMQNRRAPEPCTICLNRPNNPIRGSVRGNGRRGARHPEERAAPSRDCREKTGAGIESKRPQPVKSSADVHVVVPISSHST